MIKIENFEVVGMDHSIRGMRNPKNSWDKSDSCFGCFAGHDEDPYECKACCGLCSDYKRHYILGPNDQDLTKRLSAGGPVHAKYRRMIVVYLDITAPLYWWKEFDTYKVGTVANSCSTMHKIHDKQFTLEDFSCEHLGGSAMNVFQDVIHWLNFYRDEFLADKNKRDWWQMIQLLPSSYNQKRTIMLNYEVLTGIYESRKNHKLDEWREFCKWIEQLPYSEIITGIRDCEECKHSDVPVRLEPCDSCENQGGKLNNFESKVAYSREEE